MHLLVFIPGILMGICGISCFILLFKVRGQVKSTSSISYFFGLEILTGSNLTEKGMLYRSRYWRLFLLAFLFAILTVIFMYIFVPEFQNEIRSIEKIV